MPFDRPDNIELINALKEFMQDKVLPETSGHLNFNTRVVINVLAILERELQYGETIVQGARERLQALLESDEEDIKRLNQDLCQALEERRTSYRDASLCEHLWQTTLDKLSVDNPKYSTYLLEKR